MRTIRRRPSMPVTSTAPQQASRRAAQSGHRSFSGGLAAPAGSWIANERRDRLELLAQVVIGLGHDVIAREIYVKEVGSVTAREHPDVALVGLRTSPRRMRWNC